MSRWHVGIRRSEAERTKLRAVVILGQHVNPVVRRDALWGGTIVSPGWMRLLGPRPSGPGSSRHVFRPRFALVRSLLLCVPILSPLLPLRFPIGLIRDHDIEPAYLDAGLLQAPEGLGQRFLQLPTRLVPADLKESRQPLGPLATGVGPPRQP